MININVKKKQNGEIVSNIKEVKKVYSTFVRYKELDQSIQTSDLQKRLNPLEEIESGIEIDLTNTIDSFENIYLQNYLYPDIKVILPEETNIKPHKIIQIWVFVNNKIRKVFSLISSCFGSGTWMSSEKWVDSEPWRY